MKIKRDCRDCAFCYTMDSPQNIEMGCILEHEYGTAEECLDYFFKRPIFLGGLKDYERDFINAKATYVTGKLE